MPLKVLQWVRSGYVDDVGVCLLGSRVLAVAADDTLRVADIGWKNKVCLFKQTIGSLFVLVVVVVVVAAVRLLLLLLCLISTYHSVYCVCAKFQLDQIVHYSGGFELCLVLLLLICY